jgi:amino acid adenylation domain-containing protein/thioester reductase-like protein
MNNHDSARDLAPAQKRALLRQLLQARACGANAPFPISYGQRALWFLSQLEPKSAAYNARFAATIRGEVDATALERCFQVLHDRHPALRTTFFLQDGEVLQQAHEGQKVHFVRRDAAGILDDALQKELLEESKVPFDLEAGPLLRVRLFTVSEQHHILLVVAHHIVVDLWSLGLLLSELRILYSADSEGARAPLPPAPIPYSAYVRWQFDLVNGAYGEDLVAYWRKQLAAPLATATIPTDRIRPPVQTHRGQTYGFRLPETPIVELKALAISEQATLYMALLAVFQVLVYRYAQQEDMVIGSITTGRTRAEFAGVVGYFVNPVVIRCNIGGNPTFRAFLCQVRQIVLEALQHQDCPFPVLVERLQPRRDPSGPPFFRCAFSLERSAFREHEGVSLFLTGHPDAKLCLGGMVLEACPLLSESAVHYDLLLLAEEVGGVVYASLQYNSDLFGESAISAMAQGLRSLLGACAANPDAHIFDLPWLSRQERDRVLFEWNATAENFKGADCVHTEFERQVERTPNAVAVEHESGKVTYSELNARANQLAHHLRNLGVRYETPVGIATRRSLHQVVAVLGTLKSGGTSVLLDLKYPEDRLRFMIDDARIRILLTDGSTPVSILPHGGLLLGLDTGGEVLATEPRGNPELSVVGHHLAFVIYTSGSTGRPKGVLIQHAGLVNLAVAQLRAFGVRPGSRVLQFASPSFDAAISEVLMALLSGATLCVVGLESILPGPDLVRSLRAMDITTLTLPPSALSVMPPADLPRLRTIIAAGEPCSQQLVQQWGAGRAFFNAYGPTEATVCATAWQCLPEHTGPSVPIGRPIANTRVYLLDPALQPVPIGVPGELHIGGVGLARGYLNRPDLTAERFIPDPFSGERGARLYRTGDLARYRPDGAIEFLGRLDHQVKLRGFRIEPEEVEAVLKQHPSVRDAVVTVREGPDGGPRLVAHVVPATAQLISPGAGATWADEHVSEWQSVFDLTYSRPGEGQDPGSWYTGWVSSFTGLPLGEAEMDEWATCAAERILSLRPKRVLDIGCGVGLLMTRLAPRCSAYWGLDVSQEALRHAEVASVPIKAAGCDLRLFLRTALQVTDLGPEPFDVVVLNSVLQYFPGVDYLIEVLRRVLGITSRPGYIFLGDVRSLPLLSAFHTAVVFAAAPDTLPLHQVRERSLRREFRETELVIAPAFFGALGRGLPEVNSVSVQIKRGHASNELAKFRYDVTLGVSLPPDRASWIDPEAWLDWDGEHLTLGSFRKLLQEGLPVCIGVRRVPNRRLARDLHVRDAANARPATMTVGLLRESLASRPEIRSVDPEAFWSLGEQLGYDVVIGWSGDDATGRFDVLFRPKSISWLPGISVRPDERDVSSALASYANNPLRACAERRVRQQLRQQLEAQLPNHMVPSEILLREALPLTPSGKVDRRACGALEDPDPGGDAIPVPARDSVQAAVSNLWSEVLGVQRVGINQDFFQLGGHSLLAARLVGRVRETFGVELPLRCFFERPTVAGMAAAIRGDGSPESAPTAEALVPRDWAAECILDPAIQPPASPLATETVKDQHVLLTGATGFLGTFLLNEVLHDDTVASVYCLVRSADQRAAMLRLREALRRYGLPGVNRMSKIIPLPGDLSQPKLGLKHDCFSELGETVDTVFHLGACVNLFYPYSRLKSTNVLGTHEVIRLTALSEHNVLHHISTTGVFSTMNSSSRSLISEDLTPADTTGLRLGYTQSKWVAERLVDAGRSRGLRIAVYRLGRLSGSSRTGACQTNDLFWMVVKACIEIGAAPDVDVLVDLVPVDYVARALVCLSRGTESVGKTFHLVHRHPVPFRHVIMAAIPFRGPIPFIPYKDWHARLLACKKWQLDHSVASLIPMLPAHAVPDSLLPLRFDCGNTSQGLLRSGLECPALDSELLHRYLDYFYQVGFLRRPAGQHE